MANRYLIVEQGDGLRSLLTQIHKKQEYHHFSVASQREASDLLATESFDYVLCDTLAIDDLSEFLERLARLTYDPGLIFIGYDTSERTHIKGLSLSYSLSLLAFLFGPVDKAGLSAVIDGSTQVNDRDGQAFVSLDEADFMRGLIGDGLAAAFQPRVRLGDGRVMAVESFARWRTPEGSLLGAGAILRLARSRGYMDVLTYRVLELAMRHQYRWSKQGLSIPLSINVGSDNLRKSDFADVAAALAESEGVDVASIMFEVTESEIGLGDRVIKDNLARLHQLGFGLALDDFGNGYAALLELDTIPFDQLIIDRRFVGKATDNRVAHKVLEAALNLAHTLGLTTICEGVESEAQAKLVQELGADWGQGYYFAKPQGEEDFLVWLEQQNKLD